MEKLYYISLKHYLFLSLLGEKMGYVEEFVENLTEEQLDKLEQKIKEKKGYVPSKAYGNREDIDKAIEDLEESNVTEETKKFLLRLLKKLVASKKTGEQLSQYFSVLPQEEKGLKGSPKVNLATGELQYPLTEGEAEEAARSFLLAGTEHQRKKSLLLDEE